MSTAFKVFGSNALRTVLLHCLPSFERECGVKAAVDFGSTNHTLEIMRGGATADLIIATASANNNSVYGSGGRRECIC